MLLLLLTVLLRVSDILLLILLNFDNIQIVDSGFNFLI